MFTIAGNRHARKPLTLRELEKDANSRIAGHVVHDVPARSWYLHTPSKGGFYAYTLTWAPQTLSIAGDCGELTINHYALDKMEEALKWAATADVDYLLRKTRLEKAVDRDATFAWIIEMANENARHTMKGFREEMQAWRRDKPCPHAHDDESWHNACNTWNDDKPELKVYTRSTAGSVGMRQITVVEDGFEVWDKLREEVASYLPQEAIYKAAGRHEIKERLLDRLNDMSLGEMDAFCYHELALEDGACRIWTLPDVLKVECLRFGAQRVLADLEGTRVYSWSDWPLAEIEDAFPRWLDFDVAPRD